MNPSGNVTFATSTDVLCANVTFNAGSANCTTSVLATQGQDTQDIVELTASYSGDAGNASSVSEAFDVIVLAAGDVVFRNGVESEDPLCPIE